MMRYLEGFMLLLEVCFVFLAFVPLSLEAFACIKLNDSARYVYLLTLTCVIMIEVENLPPPSLVSTTPPPPPPMQIVVGNDVLWFRPAPTPPVPVGPATPGAFYPGRVPRKARGG